MHTDEHSSILVRPMAQADRAIIANLIASAGTFNHAEMDCARDPGDIRLGGKEPARIGNFYEVGNAVLILVKRLS